MKVGTVAALAGALAACTSASAPAGGALAWQGPVMPPVGADAAGRFYRYAPSIVQTDDDTRHAYYCGNVTSGEIKDHVLHRVAHRSAAGAWSWSPEDVALAPSDPRLEPCTGFDCYHACDPEYLEANVRDGGITYTRVLFYTGNDLDASAHNSIGMALANAPEGPWVRYPVPIVSYESQCGTSSPFAWGVGQPSATSLDGAGHIVLFARVACADGAHALAWIVDLSELDGATAPRLGPATVLPFTGLTKGAPVSGEPDASLNDASFVYDASRDRFFVVRSQHPLPLDAPANITSQLQIAMAPGNVVRTGSGTWTALGDIAPADDGQGTWATGAARNHNAGIVRTPLGAPVEATSLEIAYTTCASGSDWLWSDRIESVRGLLRN